MFKRINTVDVIKEIEKHCGSKENAQIWMNSKSPALGNMKPADKINTPSGRKEILKHIQCVRVLSN